MPQSISATHVLPRQLIVETAIPNCMQTQRMVQPPMQGHNRRTSFCSVCRHNKSSSGHTAACSLPFLSAKNARTTVTAAVSFRTCLSDPIEMCCTVLYCTAVVHTSPMPTYHTQKSLSQLSQTTLIQIVQ